MGSDFTAFSIRYTLSIMGKGTKIVVDFLGMLFSNRIFKTENEYILSKVSD